MDWKPVRDHALSVQGQGMCRWWWDLERLGETVVTLFPLGSITSANLIALTAFSYRTKAQNLHPLWLFFTRSIHILKLNPTSDYSAQSNFSLSLTDEPTVPQPLYFIHANPHNSLARVSPGTTYENLISCSNWVTILVSLSCILIHLHPLNPN